MCGIVGILGTSAVQERLVKGLERLEYRGYDSAGIAVLGADGIAARRRAPGKIANLKAALAESPLEGATGLAHTRWATHGAPTEANAHPHRAGGVTIVHNGIVENFRELRRDLAARGAVFSSETDSETIAWAIAEERGNGGDPRDAFARAVGRLEGAFAIAAVFDGQEDLMLGARRGAPLAVGIGEGETYLGSDALALAPFTKKMIFLEDGDVVALTRTSVDIHDGAGRRVARPLRVVEASSLLVEKAPYRHFMEKEIHEQPDVVARTLGAVLDPVTRRPRGFSDLEFAALSRVQIVACGTAYYAGLLGRYWIEALAGLPVDCEIASEFRYRRPVTTPGALALAVTQSGETADTLAALAACKEAGLLPGAIVNVPESSIARLATHVFPTLAGPEIGVASTKAFTCQLAVLGAFALAAAAARGGGGSAAFEAAVDALLAAPRLLASGIRAEPAIREAAFDLAKARHILFLGRGFAYPIALEAALKMKELTYIHAEGYPAGELKHGPIALIDETMPVVVFAPHDEVFEKTVSNAQEVAARGGRIVAITDPHGAEVLGEIASHTIVLDGASGPFSAFALAPAAQLLAYHVAVQRGTDVDQPRNLAKSVTVE